MERRSTLGIGEAQVELQVMGQMDQIAMSNILINLRLIHVSCALHLFL